MKIKEEITLSDQFLKKFVSDVFTPLKNGECVTCMFSAGGGKRTIFKYLLKEKNFIKNIFGKINNKTLVIFIDPDEILNLTNEAYLKLILDNLLIKMSELKIEVVNNSLISNPLLLIKKNLEYLFNQDYKVIFILNDFEFTLKLPLSIYLNLESILNVESSMSDSNTRITYLFLSTINLFNEEVLKSFQNLKHQISQNIKFFSLFNKEESFYLMNHVIKNTSLLSDKTKNLIYEMCGGHPRLLKLAVHQLLKLSNKDLINLNKIQDFLFKQFQSKIICADIWNFLSNKEKIVITSIVKNGNHQDQAKDEVNYLSNLGIIIRNKDNKFKVFGKLFEEFVRNKIPKHQLTYDEELQKLFYDQKSCESKFTFQESKLMTYFVNHQNELVSRDQIAEVIWGKQYIEKYSDWSIDKSISIIRKKLDALGFPSEYLRTLKKRGFSFTNPT